MNHNLEEQRGIREYVFAAKYTHKLQAALYKT